MGYRTAVIQSTTYEEAPAKLGPWLKQRTRWSKGLMQTWLVHMRSPGLLKRGMGWLGFAVFQLLVGGTVLAALVHSLFVTELLWELIIGVAANDAAAMTAVAWHASMLVFGYFASIVLGVVGLARRGLLSCAWALVFIPILVICDPAYYSGRKQSTDWRKARDWRSGPRPVTYSGAGPRQPPRGGASC